MRIRNAAESSGLRIVLALLILLPSSANWAWTQEFDLSAGAKPKQVHITDDGDWWSAVRDDGGSLSIERPIKRFPSEATFRIAGVSVRSDDWGAQLRKKLGPATEVDRGDASTARSQWCYRSSASDEYLLFETGEVTIGFYLLSHPKSWNGEQYCSTVKEFGEFARTASGLHLGMTPEETVKLLGNPAKRHGGTFLYSFESRQKTTDTERKRLREGQQISDEEFEQNFAYIDLTATINIEFTDGIQKLSEVPDRNRTRSSGLC
jgi:hypothetical protein